MRSSAAAVALSSVSSGARRGLAECTLGHASFQGDEGHAEADPTCHAFPLVGPAVVEKAAGKDSHAFGQPVGLQLAGVAQVQDFRPTEEHRRICDQTAVAAPPQRLGAEDCHSLPRGLTEDQVQG